MAVDYRNLYLIADNLADLYEDGIPLVLSLELLSELPVSKEYKRSLIHIKNEVIEGKTLASSFSENPSLYPKFFSGVIDIGEGSGKLVSVLKKIKEFYFHIDTLKRKIISSVRYPIFVVIALIFLSISFVLFIIPKLYETFNNFNKSISPVISFCYEFSKYIKDNKVYSIIFFICGIIGLILSYKYLKVSNKEISNKILFKFKILRQYYEYIFVMILSIIVGSGIEISTGLDLCLKSIKINNLKLALRMFKNDILSGSQVIEALRKVEFLSEYSLSMISIGEQSGTMEEILKKISVRLESNLVEKLEKMVSYVMPISIIIVTLIIMIFIFLFIKPMFDMMYSGI